MSNFANDSVTWFRATLLAGLFLVVAGPGMAYGHSVLVETVPFDRSVIAETPPVIVLRFNEPVEPIIARVLNAAGQPDQSAGQAVAVGSSIRIPLAQPLADGAYIVSFRVTSEDSHPIAGSFLFAVGAAPLTWSAPPGLEWRELPWREVALITRGILLTAMMLAVGGLAFLMLFHAGERASWKPLQPVLGTAAGVGIVCAIAGIYLQGGVLLNAPAADLSDAPIWRVGVFSTRGLALLTTAFALALGFVCLQSGATNPAAKALGWISSAFVVGAFGLSGHAATADPRWLTIPILLLHVAWVAFWLGSFVPLLVLLGRADPRTDVVRRFSTIAALGVPQLIAAGVFLTIIQVQSVSGAATTDYGRILMIKLGLVMLLLLLAALNRWILLPRLERGSPVAVTRLRHTICVELTIGITIVFVAAVLSQTIPPRALALTDRLASDLQRDGRITQVLETRTHKALMILTPARSGWNRLRVRIFDANDRVLEPMEVIVELSHPEAGIEPFRRQLIAGGDSYFEYSGPEMSVTGTWMVRLVALVSDFERTDFETEISIGAPMFLGSRIP